ncbi:MAG: ribose 5-phosphate isomerase B [Planctomycetota bacterium]|nr:MAG: ribose 5-phosphate isomerase B [Planctomycetota bacterium]
MRIAIGSDHRGFEVRNRLAKFVESLGHEVELFGGDDKTPVDYPDVAETVARKVVAGEFDRGILLCGTGLGMSIAANKVPGVRAAACHDQLTAEMSRRHNDANVLCMSAELLGERLMNEVVRIWLTTDFEGGRHARRVEKIAAIERAVQEENCSKSSKST